MKVPFQTPFVMDSPLPVSECERRLREASVSKWAMFKSRGDYPFVGKFNNDEIVLRPRLSPFVNNSWTRFFYLRLNSTASGCRIEGKLALPKQVLAFSAVWCGFMILFWLVALVQIVSRKQDTGSALALFGGPLGMLAFFFLMTKFGLWMSGFTERRCSAFLEEKLHGRVVDPRMLPQTIVTS